MREKQRCPKNVLFDIVLLQPINLPVYVERKILACFHHVPDIRSQVLVAKHNQLRWKRRDVEKVHKIAWMQFIHNPNHSPLSSTFDLHCHVREISPLMIYFFCCSQGVWSHYMFPSLARSINVTFV